MTKKYQIDISRISDTLSTLSEIPADLAKQLADLIVFSQTAISTEDVLLDKLQLIESLSELNTEKNAFLIIVLDYLIESIESYQNYEARTPNQVLADLIKQHQVKQKELAHIVPQSIISELVNGKRQLTLRHIRHFAEYFNVPISYFLNNEQ